jgi:hypothetical protein
MHLRTSFYFVLYHRYRLQPKIRVMAQQAHDTVAVNGYNLGILQSFRCLEVRLIGNRRQEPENVARTHGATTPVSVDKIL